MAQTGHLQLILMVLRGLLTGAVVVGALGNHHIAPGRAGQAGQQPSVLFGALAVLVVHHHFHLQT